MPTPYAADRWSDLESLLALIESAWFTEEHPLTVHSRNYDGDTPLHTTIVWEDFRAAEVLIQAGADVNACGEDNYRPLHTAVSFNQPKMVQLLLGAGAERNVHNGFDQTPLSLAKLLGHESIIQLLS